MHFKKGAHQKRAAHSNIGLVMTGGGARGAYQAGVLLRIGELPRVRRGRSPFSIVAGASAGAINGAAVASGNHDFTSCTRLIADLWSSITAERVYQTNLNSLGPRAFGWLKDLSIGAIVGGGHAQSLLDFSPLKTFLSSHLNFANIKSNIERGYLSAAAITATNYADGKAYIFVQAPEATPLWQKARRVTLSTELTVDHVWASAAIPILFQPVKLRFNYQEAYFGDGCLRLTSPLSPAIRLGARKLLAIGVRSARTDENSHDATHTISPGSTPPIAQVLGVILNAIFLDHLDADVDHLLRLNDIVRHAKESQRGGGEVKEIKEVKEPMAELGCYSIKPSIDIGKMAEEFERDLPPIVRYMMKGFGTKESSSSDLMSYLLFSPSFTRSLIEVGYKDASRDIDAIEYFLFGESRQRF